MKILENNEYRKKIIAIFEKNGKTIPEDEKAFAMMFLNAIATEENEELVELYANFLAPNAQLASAAHDVRRDHLLGSDGLTVRNPETQEKIKNTFGIHIELDDSKDR